MTLTPYTLLPYQILKSNLFNQITRIHEFEPMIVKQSRLLSVAYQFHSSTNIFSKKYTLYQDAYHPIKEINAEPYHNKPISGYAIHIHKWNISVGGCRVVFGILCSARVHRGRVYKDVIENIRLRPLCRACFVTGK